MDMKSLLQALDKLSAPVNETSKQLNEGANPHKVSLPVQMAMQHYQQPKKSIIKKDFQLRKFFEDVEQEIVEQQVKRKQELHMYARTIAQRVMEKQAGLDGKACWAGYRYAGQENGKDKCVPVSPRKKKHWKK